MNEPTDSGGSPPEFAFLVCDGCHEATPIAETKAEIRALALSQGWAVDVGPESQDFCAGCKMSHFKV